MSNPEPGQPPNTANGRPYGPRGHIRYTHPIDHAAPGDDTRFYGDDTLFDEEETLMSGPESEPSGPGFEPGRPEFGPLPDAAGEAAGGPEPAQPADPAGGWPYDPEPVRFADPGDRAVTGDGTWPYGEWSHEDAVPAEPAGYSLPQNLEPPTGWAGGGFHVPGDETRPAWGDPDQDEPVSDQYRFNLYETAPDDPYQPGPYPTAPYPAAPRRRSRRPARWFLVIIALQVAADAAGAGAALVHNRTVNLSPASGPAASATAGHGAAPGAGHGSTGTAPAGHASVGAQPGAGQPPAISKSDAENVVANYSKVNNKANAAYRDSLLGTIESGSSYTMDAGAYRFALGQSNRAAYVPFQLTDVTYYIPRLPQGSYPRWFAVKGTYTTVADGKNLGPAYLVFAQDSVGAAWKDVIEPDILPRQTLPQIATDSSGYAQSVAPDAARLNVAPDKIAAGAGLRRCRAASGARRCVHVCTRCSGKRTECGRLRAFPAGGLRAVPGYLRASRNERARGRRCCC
jgi:hypothetical protein